MTKMKSHACPTCRSCGRMWGDQAHKEERYTKKPAYRSSVHQEAFDNEKAVLACDVVLAYPAFTKEFDLYQ